MLKMSMEALIALVVERQALIIQSLVSIILFIVMIMAYRNFARAKKLEESGPISSGGGDISAIEETLKKLLEKANQVPTAAAVAAVGAGDNSAALAGEIETLRKSLQEKQEQIEAMKTAVTEAQAASPDAAAAPAATGLSDAEKDALNTQIKDLQAKLSEYEIISEDIADLSFYKEENSKLQKELASLKGGGSAPAPEEKPAEAAPAVEVAPEPVAPVAEEKPAPAPEAVVEAAPEAPAPAEAPAPEVVANPDEVLSADDDLMKEFAEAVNAQSPEIDVDRMSAEATELLAAGEESSATAEEILSDALDPDKLAAEAAKMDAIKPEDAKLMGDFESFVKKGNS